MDTRLRYQELIKKVLREYAQYRPAYGDIDSRVVFDDEHGSYALLQLGWDMNGRVHDCVIHIDLVGEKIWVQSDGTEDGVACDFVEAGVPKEHIVLGFRPPKIRPLTEFAVE